MYVNKKILYEKLFILLFVCIIILNGNIFCATTTNSTKSDIKINQSFNVGGVSIVIPAPTKEFVEIGYDNREILENILIPELYKLVCFFSLTNDLSLFDTNEEFLLVRYGLVNVLRSMEYIDCEEKDFKSLADGMEKLYPTFIQQAADKNVEYMNQKLKENYDDNYKMEKSVPLGIFFKKNDILGMGMISSIKNRNTITKLAVSSIMLRVRKRVICLNLYNEYKDTNSIIELSQLGEKWADTILNTNK